MRPLTVSDLASAWASEGAACQREGDLEAAAALYARALAVAPHWADVQAAHGTVLRALRRVEEAVLHYERALRLSPTCDAALRGLREVVDPAGLLTGDAVVEAALDQLMRAADGEFAASPRVRAEIAYALVQRWRTAEGFGLLRRVLRAWPRSADAWFSVGLCLARHRRLRGAVRAYTRALVQAAAGGGGVAPLELARIHVCRGLARLSLGDFEGGWADYEWRSLYRPAARVHGREAWEGQPMRGRVLFVHAEQGLGDIVLFLRFLAPARERGARIVLECPAPLVRLVEASGLADDVVAPGGTPPKFRFHVSLASLPYVLRVKPQDLAHGPYLRVPSAEVARWRDRLGNQPTVGLVWAGSAENPLDRDRSVRLASLRPLAEIEGWRAVSLQKGEAAGEAAEPGAPALLLPLTATGDFLETASLIEALDVVVGVETSVMHVAGALGRRAMAMIPFDAPWCWRARGEVSPWYPSVRLFRQPAPGVWSGVVEDMREALGRSSR